jgi:D-sedoheptulose 7-phosphate isomerase
MALTDNVPLITAWGNDASYDDVFVEQLRNYHVEGSVVVGISASGNSKNVLNAVRFARENNSRTVGLSGFDGGQLHKLVDESVVVPSSCMAHIEDVHLMICHLISTLLKDLIKDNLRVTVPQLFQ